MPRSAPSPPRPALASHLTELDVDVLPREPDMWGADLSRKAAIRATTNIYPNGLPDAQQRQLAQRYAEIFEVVMRHRARMSRVTFWGVTDAQSWLHDFPIPGRINYPLLWDHQARPKPALDAVAEVLKTQTMSVPTYKDATAPIEERVADLLSRMTLEEKAAQMTCVWQQEGRHARRRATDASTRQRPAHTSATATASARSAGPAMPAAAATRRETAELTNAIQRFFVEESRLGIPVIFHEECLHGHAATDAHELSAADRPGGHVRSRPRRAAVHDDRAEAGARGTHQALTPVVDVARDPRWGRVEETFGEDPYLVARLGVAAVRGFQGDATFRDKTRVIATLKHFAAHGQPESGNNCAPVERLRAGAARDVPQHVRGRDPRGRRDQRHGLVQRDRRRPLARQPLAAARRAARRVGLQRHRRLRLLRIRELAERPELLRPPRRRTTAKKRRCWPCAPA